MMRFITPVLIVGTVYYQAEDAHWYINFTPILNLSASCVVEHTGTQKTGLVLTYAFYLKKEHVYNLQSLIIVAWRKPQQHNCWIRLNKKRLHKVR